MSESNPVGPPQTTYNFQYGGYVPNQYNPQVQYYYPYAYVKTNRERALELAIQSQEAGYPAETTVERAQAFLAFLDGEADNG